LPLRPASDRSHPRQSSLHCLFQHQSVSRLLNAEGTRVRRRFNNYPIKYIHIDLAQVWTDEGKPDVAIDRLSTLAFAEFSIHGTSWEAGLSPQFNLGWPLINRFAPSLHFACA
jgi:hypothetical protein